jgi:hypothetical protein
MTKERATALAASLDVGLDSPGVCPACLLFVASEIETGNEQRVAGRITSFAPVLWAEGLGDVVRDALGVARERGNDDAAVALDELSGRGARSTIFRAVVRRLAAEITEEVMRSRIASMN